MSNVKCQIWLVFLLALAVRLAAAANTRIISTDGPEYVKVAKWYLAGEYDTAVRHAYHPLYPILIAVAFSLLANWELAGQAVSVLFSALAVFPLCWLVRRLFEARLALVAGVLYAFWPFAVTTSATVLTTGLFLSFFCFAVWASVEAVATRHLRYFPLAGLFSALAYLVRIDGLVLVAGFALGVAIQFFREVLAARQRAKREAQSPRFEERGAGKDSGESLPGAGAGCGHNVELPQETTVQRPLLRLVCGSLLAAVAFLCVSMPFLLALRRATGRWTLTMKLMPVEITEMLSVGTDGEKEPPKRVKKRFLTPVKLVANDFAEAAHYLVVFVLCVGLLQRRIRAKDRVAQLIIWTTVAVNLLMLLRFGMVVGRMSRRYTVGPILLCLPWAAAGLAFLSTVIWRQIANFHRRWKGAAPLIPAVPFSVVWPAVAVGLLVSVCTFAPKTFAPRGWDKQDEILAANFIRKEAKHKPVRIITYLERVAFYSDGEQVPLAAAGGTLGAVTEYARTRGIEFICVDKNVTRISAGFYSDEETAKADLAFTSSYYSRGRNEVRVYVVR